MEGASICNRHASGWYHRNVILEDVLFAQPYRHFHAIKFAILAPVTIEMLVNVPCYYAGP